MAAGSMAAGAALLLRGLALRMHFQMHDGTGFHRRRLPLVW
ncbi:hypothetical protein [Nitrobacter sp.]